MTIPLADVAREAPFTLYGIRATQWLGASFVGTVARTPAGIRSVELDYLDSVDDTTMGLGVVCVDGGSVASGEIDPLEAHCANFVPRFDPAYVVARLRRRRATSAFPAKDFRLRTVNVHISGAVTGAELQYHESLPLQVLRVAVRPGRSAVDVGIAGWQIDVKAFAEKLEPVDADFAREFDLHATAYDLEGE